MYSNPSVTEKVVLGHQWSSKRYPQWYEAEWTTLMRQNACGIYIYQKSEGGVDALNFLVEKRDTRHWGTTSLLAVAALWKGCIQCRYTSSVLGRPRCQEDKSLIQDFIPRSPLSFLSALLPKAWTAQSLLLSSSLLSFTRSSSLCLLFPTPSILC